MKSYDRNKLGLFNSKDVYYRVRNKSTNLFLEEDKMKLSVSNSGSVWRNEEKLMNCLDNARMYYSDKLRDFEVVRYEVTTLSRAIGVVDVGDYLDFTDKFRSENRFFKDNLVGGYLLIDSSPIKEKGK